MALLALSSFLYANYNQDGLNGFSRTHVAAVENHSRLGIGAGGDLFSMTNTFRDEQIEDRSIAKVYAINGFPFLSLALFDAFEASVVVPVFYEYVSIYSQDEIGMGDASLNLKYKIPESLKEFDFAAVMLLSGGSSVVNTGGMIPRNPRFVNIKNGGVQNRGLYGSGETSVGGLGVATLDLKKRNEKVDIKIHGNVGYRHTFASDPDVVEFQNIAILTGAIEYNPVPFMGLFLEYTLEKPMANYYGEKDLTFTTLSAGGQLFTEVGLELYGAVNFNMAGDTYIDDITRKGVTYDAQPYPALRITGGMSFKFFLLPQDTDNDGVYDVVDQCPNDPEDIDGFQDSDGCPDLDNDGDGIPDAKDKCPNRGEDFDDFEDTDGCPDLDNDADGIPDARDQCPNEAEDKDGYQDDDGCPDPDNDGDGICDPWVAEKGLSQQYSSVCRGADKCPTHPEDVDGFEDEDGCPDPDNDKDGIPDALDRCPTEPENFNGVEDHDGCPDLKTKKIEDQLVLKGVNFKTGTFELTFQAQKILDEVVEQLLDQTNVEIEIRGHTDDVGKPEVNKKLSQDRADAVKKYFVLKGVAAERIKTSGYGDAQPIDSNKTANGRAENRRIEMYRIK
jgi:outer membrane protein OmpA-like peptidoglycan-associated protein